MDEQSDAGLGVKETYTQQMVKVKNTCKQQAVIDLFLRFNFDGFPKYRLLVGGALNFLSKTSLREGCSWTSRTGRLLIWERGKTCRADILCSLRSKTAEKHQIIFKVGVSILRFSVYGQTCR